MSSEQQNKWTLETLYLHLNSRVDEIEKLVEQHFALSDQRSKAEVETLGAAIGAVERTAHAALLSAKEERQKTERAGELSIAATSEWRNTMQELLRASISRKEIEDRDRVTTEKMAHLTTMISRSEQRGEGLKMGWGILLAVISAVCVVGGFVIAIRKW
jgi:hypothetical protein